MREITIAYCPDPDDAFAFYALTQGKVDPGRLSLAFQTVDLDTLNREAPRGIFDVVAASFHAYAEMADRYRVLGAGGTFADRDGPVLVARESLSRTAIRQLRVAVPGTLTTAYLALRMVERDVIPVSMPMDQILDAVASGQVPAGLIKYGAQLTYGERGLERVLDLGEWWRGETGLPLPLGGLFVRRDVEDHLARRLTHLVRASVEYALTHGADAVAHALSFSPGLAGPVGERYIRMYVNERSLRYGAEEREALEALFRRAHTAGLLPGPVTLDLVD